MPGKIDLTNQKFGRLTVLYEVPKRKNNNIYWHCKCECGNEKDIRGGDLRNGSTQSCGCLQKEKAANSNSKDLLGQKFGRLTVIEKTNKRNKGSIVWKCKCDCGKIIETSSIYLTTGDTKSCGCLQKDRIHEICGSKLQGQRFGKLTVIKETEQRKYKNIIWECKCDCGNTCYVPTHSLLSKATQSCGCTKSKGEEKIIEILKQNNILFESQKTFETCRFPETNTLLFFDFYINNKYLIEYDGIQHFSYQETGWNNEENFIKTQERDKYKNQWCKENNIPLIRIPYTAYNQLELKDLLLETTSFLIEE